MSQKPFEADEQGQISQSFSCTKELKDMMKDKSHEEGLSFTVWIRRVVIRYLGIENVKDRITETNFKKEWKG